MKKIDNNAIEGVNYDLVEKQYNCEYAQEITNKLLKEGVKFNNIDESNIPWLVGITPFEINEKIKKQLYEIGEATFAYIDTIQKFYLNNNPIVVNNLSNDNINHFLNEINEIRKIDTFRLDMIIENGNLRVTEIEEVYGNAGKVCAMNDAYSIKSDKLIKSFSNRNLRHIYVDDMAIGYINENKILANYLKRYEGLDVKVQNYSKLTMNDSGYAWRFIYTKDIFNNYDKYIINTTIKQKDRFFNSLCHAFGSKNLLTLLFEKSIAKDLINELGIEKYELLQTHYPFSKKITEKTNIEEFLQYRKKFVLKVAECNENPKYEWGARGVFFGFTSKKKWEEYLQNAKNGYIPFSLEKLKAKMMISELVDSDKFDIEFYHPLIKKVALMSKARIRIGAIFFRNNNQVDFVGGHATFVNTSRKVHLGKHAICVPLKF